MTKLPSKAAWSPCMVMVVVLQHRSVWVACFVGVMVACTYERRNVGAKLPPILLGLFVLALVAIPISVYLGWTDKLVDALVESVDSTTRSRGSRRSRRRWKGR